MRTSIAVLATLAAVGVNAFANGTHNLCNVNFQRGRRHPHPNNLAKYGWVLARRVKAGNRWHPATDHALGTQKYGHYKRHGHTANATFSTKFASWKYMGKTADDVLFTSGNMRSWL